MLFSIHWKVTDIGKPLSKSRSVYFGIDRWAGGGSKRLPGWFGALQNCSNGHLLDFVVVFTANVFKITPSLNVSVSGGCVSFNGSNLVKCTNRCGNNKVHWSTGGPSVFPPHVNRDDEIKRWKLKYGANGSAVFRIHIESELKLGLSVSITPQLLVRVESETNPKLSKIGIERFQIRLPGELGFNIVTVLLNICHQKIIVIIGTVLMVILSLRCPTGRPIWLPHLRTWSHSPRTGGTLHTGGACHQKLYQQLHQCHRHHLQVDFLAKLSLGLSLSEQRSPDPAPRTRWDVSDY